MENDIDFYGTLATEVVPKYAIIVVFTACKNRVKILTKNGILPIFNISVSFVSNSIFAGSGEPFYTVDFKSYLESIFSEIIFNNVQDKRFDYYRPDFSDEFVILEVEIESAHQLKDNCEFIMEEFSEIDECYQKTILSISNNNQ